MKVVVDSSGTNIFLMQMNRQEGHSFLSQGKIRTSRKKLSEILSCKRISFDFRMNVTCLWSVVPPTRVCFICFSFLYHFDCEIFFPFTDAHNITVHRYSRLWLYFEEVCLDNARCVIFRVDSRGGSLNLRYLDDRSNLEINVRLRFLPNIFFYLYTPFSLLSSRDLSSLISWSFLHCFSLVLSAGLVARNACFTAEFYTSCRF
jgi:hypothetical protein